MPAGLPGATAALNNTGNPALGSAVIMDGLSGPKGSPFDKDNTGNASTGAMSTGIGWGPNNLLLDKLYGNPPTGVNGGFTDDTGAGGAGVNSTAIYIGGGRSVTASGVNTPGVAGTNPYTAGFLPCNAGNGGSRDGGAGPAFTGFVGKIVTAVASIANGVVVETGWVNRSGATLASGQSTLGSAAAAQAAPT